MAGYTFLLQDPAPSPHATPRPSNKPQRWTSAFARRLNSDSDGDIEVDYADQVAIQPKSLHRFWTRNLLRRPRAVRCTMIVLVLTLSIALLAFFQSRKEADLALRWVPDPETRLFEQRPLLPP